MDSTIMLFDVTQKHNSYGYIINITISYVGYHLDKATPDAITAISCRP